MAIKIIGTTVINDSRELQNIISLDATTRATINAVVPQGDITEVIAGNGLTGGGASASVTLSHADTSDQNSVNNEGATVIQDVTVDTYGHITSLGSVTMSGESWSVPTKFVSDALVLEEKLIREQTLLQNMYHFWYIGKSYRDAFESSAFPLGKPQADEFARRSIWYLNQYINTTFKNRGGDIGIDEMCYMAMIMCGEAYMFMNQPHEAIIAFKQAEVFAPERNDHLIYLCGLYKETFQYDKLLEVTTKLMIPERTFPFPRYCNFIDRDHYVDGPNGRVQALHDEALRLNRVAQPPMIEEPKLDTPFLLSNNQRKRLFVVDNYYADPYAVRDFALGQVNFKEDIRWYKGHRSDTTFRPDWLRSSFEDIIGENIVNWEYDMNGVFQVTTSKDLRYALSGERMKQMGWEPKPVKERIEEVVYWTLANERWLRIV